MTDQYKYQYRLLQQKIWEDLRDYGVDPAQVVQTLMWLDGHPEEVQRALEVGQ